MRFIDGGESRELVEGNGKIRSGEVGDATRVCSGEVGDATRVCCSCRERAGLVKSSKLRCKSKIMPAALITKRHAMQRRWHYTIGGVDDATVDCTKTKGADYACFRLVSHFTDLSCYASGTQVSLQTTHLIPGRVCAATSPLVLKL